MTAYVYDANNTRIGSYPSRSAAMKAAKKLAGRGSKFRGDRCHGIVGHYDGSNGTYTITE